MICFLATESPNMGLKMDIQDKPVMKRFFNCGQGWIRTTYIHQTPDLWLRAIYSSPPLAAANSTNSMDSPSTLALAGRPRFTAPPFAAALAANSAIRI